MKQIKAANGRYKTVFDKKDFKELHRLYVENGMSIHSVAKAMKVKQNVIQRYLEDKEWVRKKSDMGIKEKEGLKIIDLYIVKKWSSVNIAKKYGVSAQTILNYLRSHNIVRSKKDAHILHGKTTRFNCISKFMDFKYNSFIEYRYAAHRLLSSMWPVLSYTVDLEAKKELNSGYAVDHMLSIYDGYKQNIPLNMIAHPANLQVLTSKENSDKGINSCITLKTLKRRIKSYNEEYENPFKKERYL